MTFEEFCQLDVFRDETHPKVCGGRRSCECAQIPGCSEEHPFLQKTWVTGGQTGASCWDQGKPEFRSIHTEPEPDFDVLENMSVFLDLSFKTFRQVKKNIKTVQKTEHDYYGNSTEYTTKYISLKEVYDTL